MPHVVSRSSIYNLAGITQHMDTWFKILLWEVCQPSPSSFIQVQKKQTNNKIKKKPIPGHINVRAVVSCVSVKRSQQCNRMWKAVGAQSSISVAFIHCEIFSLPFCLLDPAFIEHTLKCPLLICEFCSHHYLLQWREWGGDLDANQNTDFIALKSPYYKII